MCDGLGGDAPIEIESGSETTDVPQIGDIAAEPPCLAIDMQIRDNVARKEPMQTRPDTSKKETFLRHWRNWFFDSQRGALCEPRKAITSTEMSPRLSSGSFSCCSKAWRAVHFSRLLMVPECMGALPVSDARCSGKDTLPMSHADSQEGERERLDEIAAMKYRSVCSLGEHGLTSSGEDGASLLSIARGI